MPCHVGPTRRSGPTPRRRSRSGVTDDCHIKGPRWTQPTVAYSRQADGPPTEQVGRLVWRLNTWLLELARVSSRAGDRARERVGGGVEGEPVDVIAGPAVGGAAVCAHQGGRLRVGLAGVSGQGHRRMGREGQVRGRRRIGHRRVHRDARPRGLGRLHEPTAQGEERRPHGKAGTAPTADPTRCSKAHGARDRRIPPGLTWLDGSTSCR